MTEPAWDLLLAVLAPPHASDAFTTILRLTDAALARDARVQVWACGSATLLTRTALGSTKPRNLLDWSQEHPTSATIVADLLRQAPTRLAWNVCRFCSDERGAGPHIPEVATRAPFRFAEHVAASHKTVLVGGI